MPQPPAENNRPTEHGDVFINGCSDRGSIPLASTFFIIRGSDQEKGLPKKIHRLVKMNHRSRRTPRAMECGSLFIRQQACLRPEGCAGSFHRSAMKVRPMVSVNTPWIRKMLSKSIAPMTPMTGLTRAEVNALGGCVLEGRESLARGGGLRTARPGTPGTIGS